MDDPVLDVLTPLGFRVVCSAEQWDRISLVKHPPMRGRLEDVKHTLAEPDEVRRSASSAEVVLFHRRVPPRWVCVVVRSGKGVGHLVTAYPADKVKTGGILWKR